MKPYLIVPIGISRAGKDTFAAEFMNAGYLRVAMNFPMKKAIEAMYDLPEDAMEDDCYRNALVDPNDPSQGTFLDLMVKLFKVWRQVDPGCMARVVREYLKKYHDVTNGVAPAVLVGIRTVDEVQMVHELSNAYQPMFYYIIRSGIKELLSDREVMQAKLKAEELGYPVKVIWNDGTEYEFCQKVNQELNELQALTV